jgi:RimJ/RimL family protein N-acetyltransferase
MADEIRLVEPFPVWAWPLAWEWLKPVRGRVCDDFSPKTLAEFVEYSIGVQRRARTFAVYRGAELGGVIVSEQVSPVLASIHILFSRSMRGAAAREASRIACQKLFSDSQTRKLYGTILERNRLAVALALRVGFKVEGLMEANTLQEGNPAGVVLVGITREAFNVVSCERTGAERRLPEPEANPVRQSGHGEHILCGSDGASERPSADVSDDDSGDVQRELNAGRSGHEDGISGLHQQGLHGDGRPDEPIPGKPRVRAKRKSGPDRAGNRTRPRRSTGGK